MTVRALLAVVAHPDDEIVFGGTLALCSIQGVEVTLVCTTDGAGGFGSSEMGGARLAAIRRREIAGSCRRLGIARLELFEQRTKASEPLSRHNYQLFAEVHQSWIEALIAEVAPQVVVTFGPDGLTGHPTHVAVGQLAANAVRRTNTTSSLLQVALTRRQVSDLRSWLAHNPTALNAYHDEVQRNPRVGPPSPLFLSRAAGAITHRIDVTRALDRKMAAIACHRSQGGGGGILDAFGQMAQESFVQAMPTPGNGRYLEDIFKTR